MAAEAEHLASRRVHIMGMGSIGSFLAHCLMCLPNPPPISLLFHRAEMYEDFLRASRIVRLINPRSGTNDERTGYDVDVARYERGDGRDRDRVFWKHISHRDGNGDPVTGPVAEEVMSSGEIKIYTVIVAVKGPVTVAALRSIKHRISVETTICLMQNGMGQVDELNRHVFTDPACRPTYLVGVVSHGVSVSKHFVARHSGIGSTAVGVVRDVDKYPLPERERGDEGPDGGDRYHPTEAELYGQISARYLVRTLTRSPTLVCAALPYLDLVQLQLEKLAINALIDPLTALLDMPNGSLLGSDSLSKASRLLLAEISTVVRGLPELHGLPNISTRFSPSRLESLYLNRTSRTRASSSSMREDIRKYKAPEIDYINGYIIRRGQERGLQCVLNYLLLHLVKAHSWEHSRGHSSTSSIRRRVAAVGGGGGGGGLAPGQTKSIPYGITLPSASPSAVARGVGVGVGPVTLEDKGTRKEGERGRIERI